MHLLLHLFLNSPSLYSPLIYFRDVPLEPPPRGDFNSLCHTLKSVWVSHLPAFLCNSGSLTGAWSENVPQVNEGWAFAKTAQSYSFSDSRPLTAPFPCTTESGSEPWGKIKGGRCQILPMGKKICVLSQIFLMFSD